MPSPLRLAGVRRRRAQEGCRAVAQALMDQSTFECRLRHGALGQSSVLIVRAERDGQWAASGEGTSPILTELS